MIANMQDEELRLKFLQKDHTLDEVIDICQKKEDAMARSKLMNAHGETTKKINHKQKPKPKGDLSKGKPPDENKKVEGSSCSRCGYAMHDNHSQ